MVAGARRRRVGRRPDDGQGWTWAQRLLALGGVLLPAVVAIKVLQVSHMDLTTAQVLVTSTPTATILVGMLLLFFPAVPPLVLFVTWRLLKGRRSLPAHDPRRGSTGHLSVLAVAAVALVLMVTTVPLSFLLLVAAGGVGLAGERLLGVAVTWVGGKMPARRRSRPKAIRSRRSSRFTMPHWVAEIFLVALLVAATAPLVIQIFNDAVWLAPLQVVARSGEQFVGYEVSSTDTRVTILREDDRRIVFLPPDGAHVQPCRLTWLMNSERSLWGHITHEGPPATPLCL